jgi:hypothetical protein
MLGGEEEVSTQNQPLGLGAVPCRREKIVGKKSPGRDRGLKLR